ncbi:flagellar protein FliT [Mesobacillus foraminis]|uniref:Flagellar protein FliT n=1 Tax=Mesobacillus foraminis TaxID=279826 RepID=A0A4R2BJG6_9BACI|nr:flagellar protein FliT [Mesobacillus foraminis]TCN26753.1 flagellar protein FliT [Mesobacillus foraminis]
MSAVRQVYQLTLQLIEVLQKDFNRDQKITLVEELLQKREEAMKGMVAPYTDEEKQLGKKLIELNSLLDRLLASEKNDIQKDLKELNVKKESSNKYVNPYQSLAVDGMFYDKRN